MLRWLIPLSLLTLAVHVGALRDLDRSVVDLFQSVRTPWLDLIASVIGLPGQVAVAGGIALGLAAARYRHSPRAAVVPLCIGATVIIEVALKLLVPQDPPLDVRARTVEVLPLLQGPFRYSFPSGNIARAAFLLRITHGLPNWSVVVGIALMAVTRLYLGEHWPSDVVGGIVLGLGIANVARGLDR